MTITGTILNTDGTPYVGIVSFASLSTPFASGGNTVTDKLVKKQTSAAGALPAGFSLAAGFYRVNTERDEWLIEVLSGAGSVDISTLTVAVVPIRVVDNAQLMAWVLGGAFTLADESIEGVNAACAVTWPSPENTTHTGTYTITSWSEEHDRETAFEMTHLQARKKIVQAARSLNEDGAWTTPPELTITDLPTI